MVRDNFSLIHSSRGNKLCFFPVVGGGRFLRASGLSYGILHVKVKLRWKVQQGHQNYLAALRTRERKAIIL